MAGGIGKQKSKPTATGKVQDVSGLGKAVGTLVLHRICKLAKGRFRVANGLSFTAKNGANGGKV
ncbi:hypothetical protein ZHAS_00003386 [Anopheles sinensis]|uniref:Uncharacterized protein n=1 Tax=Anopheles sinensis TaxID=74873 RepID=A0A084VE75_ANOSI|nr:hypothetical protein ZHAS_00003386 [Anopheles sinensis]